MCQIPQVGKYNIAVSVSCCRLMYVKKSDKKEKKSQVSQSFLNARNANLI